MLDTVILTVQEMDYKIIKPDLFRLDANDLYKKIAIGRTYVNNFKSKDKYFPRLSITPRSKGKNRITSKDLKIEFSVTKLVHGNNLKELSIFDENFVYEFLTQRLLEMGVELRASPATFNVSGFDTAKNIFLSHGYFSFQIIEELNKCTLDRRLDLDHKSLQRRQRGNPTILF